MLRQFAWGFTFTYQYKDTQLVYKRDRKREKEREKRKESWLQDGKRNKDVCKLYRTVAYADDFVTERKSIASLNRFDCIQFQMNFVFIPLN